MSALVLGASGQLARHLQEELPDATCWGRSQLDLARSADIAAAIARLAPSVIVNAAAYTAVDKAESERAAAWTLNAGSPAVVAQTATALGVPLVHVSTDYVFDGKKASEYDTHDPVCPINVYGATKLAGELAVSTLCDRSWILRTSWVFSEHGANFMRTMLRLAATRDSLRVVSDQVGRPTYAGDLAKAIAHLVARLGTADAVDFGLYHATGGAVVSWAGFATEIVERAHALGLLATRPSVIPITTAEYPTAARRPANSALKPSAAVTTGLDVAFDWRRSLEVALRRLSSGSPDAAQASAST